MNEGKEVFLKEKKREIFLNSFMLFTLENLDAHNISN